jgi:hypothetical protein
MKALHDQLSLSGSVVERFGDAGDAAAVVVHLPFDAAVRFAERSEIERAAVAPECRV